MPEANVKQRQFVSEIIKGKSPSVAASAAGYSPDYGSELMKNPAVRGLLHVAMKTAGIDDILLARKLREGLDARTPPKKEGGKQYPDQFVRKQYLDVIFKLRGDYAPEKSEHLEKTIHLTIDRGMIQALRDTDFIDAEDVALLEEHLAKEDNAHTEAE